jgi:hypothetical protein
MTQCQVDHGIHLDASGHFKQIDASRAALDVHDDSGDMDNLLKIVEKGNNRSS